ncbi:hypothetical protein D3C78_952830 [compost metagenome]
MNRLLPKREQFGQGIDEQALAKTPRTGQEVVIAFLDQLQGDGGLVDVIAVILADAREGLDTDGQLLALHGQHRGWRRLWRL